MSLSLSDRLSRWLLRLYPPAWRERYGDEFLALLQTDGLTLRRTCDVIAAAVGERVVTFAGAAFGAKRGFFVGAVWRLLQATGIKAGAIASAALLSLSVDALFRGDVAPVYLASTWTFDFVAALLTSVVAVSAATYAMGRGVLAVRRLHSPDADTHASTLMSVLIMLVVSLLASHPPSASLAAPFRAVNPALGGNHYLWMFVVQFALPDALAPWYRTPRSFGSGTPQ